MKPVPVLSAARRGRSRRCARSVPRARSSRATAGARAIGGVSPRGGNLRARARKTRARSGGSKVRDERPPPSPQDRIGERGNVRHVNAGAHHRTAFASIRSAAGISAPSAANTIAPSSSSGGAVVESPAHSAPSARAKAWVAASPGRVNANTRRPWKRATWATMCAEEPNPNRPSRSASPVIPSARYPISPAHSSGAI